jgi:hypothetical protein
MRMFGATDAPAFEDAASGVLEQPASNDPANPTAILRETTFITPSLSR